MSGKTQQRSEHGQKGKTEEKTLRAYFLRLFGKFDFRDEKQFVYFAKWLVFIILLVVELMLAVPRFRNFSNNWKDVLLLLTVEGALTIVEAVKLFAVKNKKIRIPFHIFGLLCASAFMLVVGENSILPLMVYMLVLTAVYMSAERQTLANIVFSIGTPLYAAAKALLYAFRTDNFKTLNLTVSTLGVVIALAVHFIVITIAMAFYRQYLRLNKALKELDESKAELEKAYAVAAEVIALEERQRIAKEIHDTAGHSITTVIMQTEAAKLILDKSPEEAKTKIVAANLQAKHALEELRDSVHLLSGISEQKTLKAALEGVLHESSDGTGIKIRAQIEDAKVSEAKYRFLCNSLKEGISNGLRHGGATAFFFEFKREDDGLFFLLSDNGKGLEQSQLKEGFGLSTLRERAKTFGGEVSFITDPDEGFEIRMRLPVDRQADGNEAVYGKE